jgi:hypothetical protein
VASLRKGWHHPIVRAQTWKKTENTEQSYNLAEMTLENIQGKTIKSFISITGVVIGKLEAI